MELLEILNAQHDVHVIDSAIGYEEYGPMDLSAANKEITEALVSDSTAFQEFITSDLAKRKLLAAYGGYNERRLLYKRSVFFSDDFGPERDIHIGLDIWTEKGTPVLAALDGVVHSFDYNAGKGNYGPTIILKHEIDGVTFHTLYGHLTMDDIEDIEIGHRFEKGEQIAKLGDSSENGDYPSHLHFQIIRDLEGNFGDYPGVCNESDLPHYLENCPDPNLLLKIKHTT
ncbi:MAG: peptidase M23 [Proteobacteria bacterium]|nr:MAG: peptidase M23 [Pseudomonadota bacterium]